MPENNFQALKSVDQTLHAIERFFALLAGVFIFALMLLGVAQIVGRQLFNSPIFGYIDLVELLMTAFAFLAIAYTDRLGGHIRMELLVGWLQGRWLWFVELLGILIALFVIGVLIKYSFDHAMVAYEFGDTTIDAEYLWWPSKMLVPFAFSLLWLRLTVTALALVRLIIWPDSEPIAVPMVAKVEAQAARQVRDVQAVDKDRSIGN